MGETRFAQLSDLHLGVRFTGGKLGMPAKCAEQRERELRAALVLFVETAIEEKVNLVLIPGDIFDAETPSLSDVNFVIEQVNRLHPIPTFVTSGNHDPYSRMSIYNIESALHCERRSSAPRWGDHVRIFSGREFMRVRLDGVGVTGCAFYEETAANASGGQANASGGQADASGGQADASLKAALDAVPPEPDVTNILMFHGALTGFATANEPEVMPFTTEDLAACGYDYAAIGHYHSPRLIADSDGWVAGAYSGGPLALDLSDTGERGFIIGALRVSDRRPFRPAAEDIRFVKSDPRQIRHVSLDITNCAGKHALEALVTNALQDVPSQDIVYLRLAGRYPPGMPPQVSPSLFDGRFHVRCEDASEADYDLPFGQAEAVSLRHDVRSLFLRRLRERWEQASSLEEKKLIEEAAVYGLDALTQGKVSLR